MLEIEVQASRTLATGDLLDNDIANTMAVPEITLSGALDPTQVEIASWWMVENASSTANAFKGRVIDEDADPAALTDGLAVCFEVPATLTNTGAATFQLQSSDGTALGSGSIKKRGRDVVAGDLVAGQKITLRWDESGTVWQLMESGLTEAADIVPGAVAWGSNNASTATAYVMQFTPAPASLVAGMRVAFAVPAANTGAVTLQLQNGSGTNIGGTPAIQRLKSDGTVGGLSGGELRSGMIVELRYTGSVWILVSDLAGGGPSLSTGLVVTNNSGTPDTIIDVSADELVVRNAGGAGLTVAVNAKSANIASAGAGGLDTGAAANSTWYFVWVVVATDGTINAMLSASASSPTMPANYTHKALVGAVYRDSGGLFYRFWQHGRRVFLRSGGTLGQVFTDKAAAVGNTYEALAGADLTAFRTVVPSIAKMVHGCAGGSDPTTGGAAIALAADGNGLGEVMINVPVNNVWDTVYASAQFAVPCIGQTLYWKSLDTELQNFIRVTGWEF